MSGQADLRDMADRLRWLCAAGDPLKRLRATVYFEAFRAPSPGDGRSRPTSPAATSPARACGRMASTSSPPRPP